MNIYEKYKKEILRDFRKEKSCETMSSEIGFSYNQYYKYETSLKRFLLKDFFHVSTEVTTLDLKEIINDSLDIRIDVLDARNVVRAFCHKWGAPSRYMVEKKLNMSYSKWWRIYNGKTEIVFEDFLKLVDILSFRLKDFLGHLLSEKRLKELRIGNDTAKDFIEKNPQALLVLAGICLQSYKNCKKEDHIKVLSKIIKIPEKYLKVLVDIMLTEKILNYENHILKVGHFSGVTFESQKNVEVNKEKEDKKSLLSSSTLFLTKESRDKVLLESRDFQRRIDQITECQDTNENFMHEMVIFQMLLDI